MGRDGRCHFPRAWLREGENYLAKEEQRGLFRGTRVTLLKRGRLLDGACPRGDPCDRSAKPHLSHSFLIHTHRLDGVIVQSTQDLAHGSHT